MYRYIQHIKNNDIVKTLLKHKRLLMYVVAAVLLVIMLSVSLSRCTGEKTDEASQEVVLEDTPIEIEDVRPTGELYVSTAIMEDYTTLQRTERHLGIIPEEHSCVQIVRQKCSFVVDLDKVVYEKDTLNRLYVRLPELRYVASTQNSPFMSDDEDFWIESLPNTNGLKQKVARQIRERFDTPENRKKAKSYAESAVSAMLSKMGYEVTFVSEINTERR